MSKTEKCAIVLNCLMLVNVLVFSIFAPREPWAKPTTGDRSRAKYEAIYTNEDFQPSLDAILRARGETK